jgi:ATP-dependent RNA helicase RhlE
VARKLEQTGLKCATLHANRSQNQRLKALADFKSGAVRVLVATDIAARGIDVDGISHVVNYDFPMHAEDYVHRIGRTGRAQAIGDAISFISPEDLSSLRALEKFIGRGLVRKRAEGFNYAASAPPRSEEPPRHRDPRAAQFGHVGRPQPGRGGQQRGGRAQGGGGGAGGREREDTRGQGQARPQRAAPQDPRQSQAADTAKKSLWRRLSGK